MAGLPGPFPNLTDSGRFRYSKHAVTLLIANLALQVWNFNSEVTGLV
jgi:hypothetical protein